MMRSLSLWVWFALAAGSLGCGPESPATATLSEEDLAGIRTLADAYVDAALNGDGASLATLYDERATQLPPNAAPRVGLRAIRTAFDSLTDGRPAELSYWALDWSPDGHGGGLVYDWGTYAFTVLDSTASEPVTRSGTYLVVLKKQTNGTWRILQEAWTSEGAATE